MLVSGDNGEERRHYERLMREILFDYEILGQNGYSEISQWYSGLILDISIGGVRFLTTELITKNTLLGMEFDLGDLFREGYRDYLPDLVDCDGPVRVKGKVMWSTATTMEDEYEIGVQFIEDA